MKFVRKKENTGRYVDNIFSVVQAAKKDPDAINATAGCLYDEDGKLFTYRCVFDSEDRVPDVDNTAIGQGCDASKPATIWPERLAEGCSVGYPSEEFLQKQREAVQTFCTDKVGSRGRKGYYSPELDNCCERDFEV